MQDDEWWAADGCMQLRPQVSNHGDEGRSGCFYCKCAVPRKVRAYECRPETRRLLMHQCVHCRHVGPVLHHGFEHDKMKCHKKPQEKSKEPNPRK